ncbi:MAG TPA: dihydroorotate dehydrogenase, partial [bacterium]|nr:dihydroorotate dehydrogenase [bacterium]
MQRSPGPELSCRIAGVLLPTPLVLASGIWGTSPTLLERAARAGAGAVTAKTCTPAPRRGHRNPTAVDWGHGLLNAMGLPNPGAEEEVDLLREAARRLRTLGVALIASIAADTVEDFGRAAAIVSEAGPDLIEINISCPNVESSGEMFAASAEAASAVTRQVKASTG